jgi:integrase
MKTIDGVPQHVRRKPFPKIPQEHLLWDFLARCRKIGLSEYTITNRTTTCRPFLLRFPDPTVVTEDDVREFITRGSTPESRRQIRNQINQFYIWLIKEGQATYNPAAEIRMAKVPGLPHPCPTWALRAALETAAPRTKALILLGAYGGLRIGEIVGLCVEDIDFEAQNMKIRGKGDKLRIVPINSDLMAALKEVLPESGKVFFGAETVRDLITEQFKSVGAKVTPHDLRHWCGTTIYRTTQDLMLVARILGHSDIQTALIYTKADTSKDRERLEGLATA